jgi:hypothetical protein
MEQRETKNASMSRQEEFEFTRRECVQIGEERAESDDRQWVPAIKKAEALGEAFSLPVNSEKSVGGERAESGIR